MTKYNDLNTNYNPRNITTSPTASGMESIKRSLLRLLSTPAGSVPFDRDYGTHIREMLFENDLDTHDVKMFLYMDISKYEPRIKMSPMDIVIEETDEHTYTVTCGFTVPSLNDATGTVSSTVKEE